MLTNKKTGALYGKR